MGPKMSNNHESKIQWKMCRVWRDNQDRQRDTKKLQGPVGSQGML